MSGHGEGPERFPTERKVCMPKIRTNSSAAKRFWRSKNGKFKRHMAFARHLMTGKAPKRKRHLRSAVITCAAEEKRIKRLLPYG